MTSTRRVFKCGHDVKNVVSPKELLEDFIANNYAVYGWFYSSVFANMKGGDLLIINSGYDLTYVGEVTMPPHKWEFCNLDNMPDFFKEKFAAEQDKWVMINVKKWYDIKHLNLKHKSIASGFEIHDGEKKQDGEEKVNLVTKINEIYDFICKNNM